MNGIPDIEDVDFDLVELLEETGARLTRAREELERLRQYRDQLLLAGSEAGLTTASMARAVGMRREQAHYAITRARATALERVLLEEVR